MPWPTSGQQPVSRPELLVVVAGTGTEVGKTWVAASVARELERRGVSVAARKPAQSYEPGSGPTDAEVLGEATGDTGERVCPPHRWYPLAMAPPMAAEVLERPSFTIDDLVDELSWPDGIAVGLVESAGGPRSPLAADGDTVDLVRRLGPDLVVLVADAGLGTINATRLGAAAFGDVPLLAVLNRFDPEDELHRRNLAWLRDQGGLDVLPAEELAPRLRARLRDPVG